jgi:type IV pilus assembly protein PilA
VLPKRRRGFTLIELLIVVLIIGILAAIAIPKFRNTKGKAFLGSMKADLRNLATAQESYFYEYSTYASDTALLNYSSSNGVEVNLASGDASGWGAQATHPQAYPLRCALFIGAASHQIDPATTDGQVTCDGF